MVKASVDATGEGAAFDYFVLSDTTDPQVAAREEATFAAWREREAGSPSRLVYRRRETNEGFKAGNVRDFCRRWGAEYEFMLPLDADSVSSRARIRRSLVDLSTPSACDACALADLMFACQLAMLACVVPSVWMRRAATGSSDMRCSRLPLEIWI